VIGGAGIAVRPAAELPEAHNRQFPNQAGQSGLKLRVVEPIHSGGTGALSRRDLVGLRDHLNPNALRLLANRALNPLDLGIYRKSWVDSKTVGSAPYNSVELPEGAAEVLRLENPRLRELHDRYRDHPAAKHSQWSDLRLGDSIELPYFRGDNQFIYQARGTESAAYALSAFYARDHDTLSLFDLLDEDGAFGALTHIIDGRVVSRDLLDSVLEINFLAETLGVDQLIKARVLDIGAGYGRMAHRMTAWSSDIEYLATDAVPLSTFLSEYYLGYRGVSRAKVIPLDEVEGALPSAGVDLALNIHSFGEVPKAAITWWLEILSRTEVPRLFIVHTDDALFSTETNMSRMPYDDVLARLGYERVDLRPKYAHSETVQRLGAFPTYYHYFEKK
jgi:hypothetical protein